MSHLLNSYVLLVTIKVKGPRGGTRGHFKSLNWNRKGRNVLREHNNGFSVFPLRAFYHSKRFTQNVNKASEMHQMKPFPFPMALILPLVPAELEVTSKELAFPQMLSKYTSPGPPRQRHRFTLHSWSCSMNIFLSMSFLKSPAFCKRHQSETN